MMMLTRGSSGLLWFWFCMLVHVIDPAQGDRVTDNVVDVPLIRDRAEEARHHVSDNARLYSDRPIMKFTLFLQIDGLFFNLTQPPQGIDHQHHVDYECRNSHLGRDFRISVMRYQLVN